MKVCVTATSAGLGAQVDPRFGRAQYFVFVDTNTMSCESIPNPNVSVTGGAGVQAAQLVAEKGAEVVITGHVGPNAASALSAAGVKTVTGVQGLTVREAVEKFIMGKLVAGKPEATVSSHSGSKRAGSHSEIKQLKEEINSIKDRLAELEKRIRELESR
ncbi:MAG: dinitrogenase iron-molybdenum cofactor biosynthesis protein [Deferribacteres bacterium]|nr:dinitrogenase iron-molybdenum cofactor biosynthesis protein [Deferribacteres bacterium]